jgi:ribosomal protein L7/L12
MGGRYDIMQRIKEMLDASDPLKYGNTEQARAIEIGPSPEVTADPRLEELLRSPASLELSQPAAPVAPTFSAPPPPPVNVPLPVNVPPERPVSAVPTPVAPPGQGQEELVALLRDGRKIMAVKRYREMTGVGLAEAKAAVDDLEQQIAAGVEPVVPLPGQVAPRPAATPDMEALAGQVVSLLQRGNKIEAIRVYREAMNAGLREAKEAVETIEAQLRQGYQAPVVAPPPAPPPAPRAGRPMPAWMAPVVEQLQGGNKIGAIKAYREATGVGLAEAKATVEALERQLAGRG